MAAGRELMLSGQTRPSWEARSRKIQNQEFQNQEFQNQREHLDVGPIASPRPHGTQSRASTPSCAPRSAVWGPRHSSRPSRRVSGRTRRWVPAPPHCREATP